MVGFDEPWPVPRKHGCSAESPTAARRASVLSAPLEAHGDSRGFSFFFFFFFFFFFSCCYVANQEKGGLGTGTFWLCKTEKCKENLWHDLVKLSLYNT